MNLCFVFCHRQLSSIHENSQTEGVGNEVRQRASKDLASCYKGEKPGNKGFSPATGSATG
ncbi:tweety protein [Clostridium sp. MCC345]|uniref:tweety protein n=1 Tax=Clostridium sp. MCC345 TaxID=2592645 RepID=UPI001D4163A1|nr:tweety protein [Clostridium sp. MCC345]